MAVTPAPVKYRRQQTQRLPYDLLGLDEKECRLTGWVCRHAGSPRFAPAHIPADFDWHTQIGPDGEWIIGEPPS